MNGSNDDILATADVVEAMSGVDYFNRMENETENRREDQDTCDTWKRLFGS
jgi:hypothetical protein